jgi:hypothetical protein
MSRSCGLFDPDVAPDQLGKCRERQQAGAGIFEVLSNPGELGGQCVDDPVVMGGNGVGVGYDTPGSMIRSDSAVALADGVDIMSGPNTAIAEAKSGFLSPDGRYKAFDESAHGYGRVRYPAGVRPRLRRTTFCRAMSRQGMPIRCLAWMPARRRLRRAASRRV